ncbi:Uncharacterized protein FKW44_008683, partial [Caligus rogercresseyi]
MEGGFVEVKSKFDAEFLPSYESFQSRVESLHFLSSVSFTIAFIDPSDNDLLPINNTDNYTRALVNAKPLLRLVIQRLGEFDKSQGGGAPRSESHLLLHRPLLSILAPHPSPRTLISISRPSEFRQVSAIIDVDLVQTHAGAYAYSNTDPTSLSDSTYGTGPPSGSHPRDSKSTGLLAVNDEVLEVNGIEIAGKSLDQVTDMMVANSSNLIVT